MHGIILGGQDLDGSTDKNLPYFVVENLATLPTYGTQLVGLYILLYMVAQNKIPHLKICNISATMQWSDFKNS